MGTTALALELLIAATTHVAELSALLGTANKEGRDITPEELDAVRGRATAALDALEAAKR